VAGRAPLHGRRVRPPRGDARSGCGGAGGNTITRLHRIGVKGAETIVLNTDKQALDAVEADKKLLIGKSITRGIRPVFLPAFARARREGGSLSDALGQGFVNFSAFAWPFFLVLGLVPGPTVRLLFGAHWDPAAPVLQILCIAGFTIPFTAFVSDVLVACGRVRLHMVLQVALKLALVVLVIFGARISLETVAYAVVAAEFLRVVVGIAAVHSSIEVDWRYFARAMALNAFVALATAAGPLLLVSFTQLPDVEMLALVALSAAVGWLAAVFATGHPVCKEFNRLALRLKGGAL
jgi:O-antigen/teichoic acid export membrane protein